MTPFQHPHLHLVEGHAHLDTRSLLDSSLLDSLDSRHNQTLLPHHLDHRAHRDHSNRPHQSFSRVRTILSLALLPWLNSLSLLNQFSLRIRVLKHSNSHLQSDAYSRGLFPATSATGPLNLLPPRMQPMLKQPMPSNLARDATSQM